MRDVSQIRSMIQGETNSMLFALEAVIVSVKGGTATVKPTVKRWFDDNDEPTVYPAVEDVRLLSLVWNGGKTGVTGQVKAGDPCLLIALSHGDEDAQDHKTISRAVALCGFSDASEFPFPGNDALTLFNDVTYITLRDKEVEIGDGAGEVLQMKQDSVSIVTHSGANALLQAGTIHLTAPAGATITANTQITGNLSVIGDISWTGTATGVPGTGGGGSLRVKQAWVNGIEHGTHGHDENGEGRVTDGPQQL